MLDSAADLLENEVVPDSYYPDSNIYGERTSEVITNDAGASRVRTVDMTTGAVSDADPSVAHGSRCLIF